MRRKKRVLQGIALTLLIVLNQQLKAQGTPVSRLIPVSHVEAAPTTASDDLDAPYSSSASDPSSVGAEPPPRSYKIAPPVQNESTHPFSSWQIGVKATSMGAGLDLATNLTKSFGLRGQFNLTSFNYLFNIDGVDYDSTFNLRSGSFSMDWYPTRHSFRISPGVLYFSNNLDAISGVPPGNYFELGSTGFINSVDDPLNGDAKLIFDRRIAPMVTFGYNLVGRRESRFTMPIEVGFAYTGPARINVVLNGTACTNEGCFTFAENQEAQESMQEEIAKLNKRLSGYPVYPIVSLGFAYRFGGTSGSHR